MRVARSKILYEDGTTTEVVVKPSALVQVERKYKGTVPPIEGSLFAAWVSLGRPGGGFDAWLDTVAAVEESVEDPTSAAGTEP